MTRRTHEIGVRMALGARPTSVLWLVIREGLPPVVLGTVVGDIAAIAVAHGMQALLYGVAPLDPVSFVAAAGLLFVTALIATFVPAHRAAGLDPLRSLRTERDREWRRVRRRHVWSPWGYRLSPRAEQEGHEGA